MHSRFDKPDRKDERSLNMRSVFRVQKRPLTGFLAAKGQDRFVVRPTIHTFLHK